MVDRCREFCLRHPEVRDVCDLGQMLYFGWRWAWYLTAAMFLLNNTFIQVGCIPRLDHTYLTIPGLARFGRCQIFEYNE